MSVKCYFSGVESSMHLQHCISANVVHVLMSYWQFRDKNPFIVKSRKKKYPQLGFMIDSGAHTFITEWQKFTGWTRKQFDDYAEEYARWIYNNRRWITSAVEFDIDHTLNMVLAGSQHSQLGASIVESWQKQLFMPLQKKGIDIVYVWHETRRMEGWEEMCSKFDYVGLPGYFSSEPDFNKYMAVARRYTTRVHGFAATKQLDFRDIPWYSIDSITWKTGEMYGTLIEWDDHSQKLIFLEKKDRPMLREKMRKLGYDADAIIEDRDYKEVTRYGLASMRRMEAFYERRYKDRTFYYELRLPHRDVIQGMRGEELTRLWNLFRPENLFPQHVGKPVAETIKYLKAISAVQNGDHAFLTQNMDSINFLKSYFPKLVDPLVSDIKILQREVAAFTAPPNPPALPRTEPSHWVPTNSPPKAREPVEYKPEDLDMDDPAAHFLSHQL